MQMQQQQFVQVLYTKLNIPQPVADTTMTEANDNTDKRPREVIEIDSSHKTQRSEWLAAVPQPGVGLKTMRADVSEYEWKHLQPGEYINDVVVDILLREISTTTDKLYCPSSHIFQLLKKFSITQLLPWLPRDTSKAWVLPTCDNYHWALVIIDFANKSIT